VTAISSSLRKLLVSASGQQALVRESLGVIIDSLLRQVV
jgi:hypothetical protein